MIITILNDNRPAANHFASEHGLSVHIACEGASLLLDTGQTDKFLTNAQSLGIDIKLLDAAVISHGHYDHAGGLSALANFINNSDKDNNMSKSLRLFIGEGATTMRYSLSAAMLKPNGMPDISVITRFDTHVINRVTNISIPATTTDCFNNPLSANGNMSIVKQKTTDTLQITLFTLPTPAPPNPRLVIKNPITQSLIPDTFPDELFTLLQHKGQNVLFGGCTHHGLQQLLSYVHNNLHINSLTAFIGGLHLSGRTPEEIQEAAQYASTIIPVKHWIVNHCTGDDAILYWKQTFNTIPSAGYSGQRLLLQNGSLSII